MKLILSDTKYLWMFLYNANIGKQKPKIYPLIEDILIDPASGDILSSSDTMVLEIPINCWSYDWESLAESLDCLKDNLLAIIITPKEEIGFIKAMFLDNDAPSSDKEYWEPRIRHFKVLTGYTLIPYTQCQD